MTWNGMLQAADNLPEQFAHQSLFCQQTRRSPRSPGHLSCPLLETSPVANKGGSKSDLLGASEGQKSRAGGVLTTSLPGEDGAAESPRPGCPQGAPHTTPPRSWVPRSCAQLEQCQGTTSRSRDHLCPPQLHFSCPGPQTLQIGLSIPRRLPAQQYFLPPVTYTIICSLTDNRYKESLKAILA